MLTTDDKKDFEKFERFVSLKNGEFWLCRIDDKDRNVSLNQLLMISQIDYIDNAPHTIHLRLHPSVITSYKTTAKFLVDDFLDSFEYVEKDEAEKIRKKELEEIQNRMNESQKELQEACVNTELMDSLLEKEMPKEKSDKAGLPIKHEAVNADVIGAIKSQKVISLMDKGLTEQGIEQIKLGMEEQKDIAVRRGEWISKRTKKLTKIASELTPYFEEKAAVALALTKDMSDYVDNLMKGIGNLNLYVLKNVEVTKLKEGVSAPSSLKLSLSQRVLYMDEELAVWADVGDDWDYSNEKEFLNKIAEDERLVNQIFPTERSVVSIAATRKKHDYVSKGYHAIEAEKKKLENQRQFLLIRDGENIYIVLSPELFHNYSYTLFPTTNEAEAPFKGVNGEDITYRDLDYTDSVKEHENMALGYKRLLILLCGLDHNKNIFGDFYEGEKSLNFVSMKFQEDNFNFIHDVDGTGMLPSYRPKSIQKWVENLNSEIGVGTHVLINWRKAFSVESIPSCFERESRYNSEYGRSLEFTPIKDGSFISGKLKKSSDRYYLEVPVSGRYNHGDYKEFKAKLDVSYVLMNEDLFSVLCLDRLNPDDAEWYLHDRPSRNLNVLGIKMMKEAVKMAKFEREETKELRDKLLNSIMDSKILEDKEEAIRLIDTGIAKWKCANHKKDVSDILEDSKLFYGLCDQLYQLSGKAKDLTEDVKQEEEKLGKKVLRISLSADGSYIAYSEPLEKDKDNRLVDFYWSEKTVYSIVRGLLKPKKSKFVLLKRFVNDETLKFEIENISDYIAKYEPFKTPTSKSKALDLKDLTEMWNYLHKIKGDEEPVKNLILEFTKHRSYLISKNKGNLVIQPELSLPIGHLLKDDIYSRFGFSGYTKDLLAWLVGDNSSIAEFLIKEYSDIYVRSCQKMVEMEDLIDEYKDLELHEILNLSELSKKSEVTLLSNETEVFYSLPKNKIKKYSIQAKIDLLIKRRFSIYIENKDYKDLDKWLNIKKPINYKPLIVIKREGFGFDTKEIHIFEISDDLLEKININSVEIVNSIEELENNHKEFSYTKSNGENSKKILMEWKEIEQVEKYGKKSFLSYGYEKVGEEKVKDPFK